MKDAAMFDKPGHLTENMIEDKVDLRLKVYDDEVLAKLDHVEQKLAKDFDGKLQRVNKSLL